MEILYLSRADVEAVGLTMAEIIEVVENAFRDKALGQVEMPPKPGIHTRPDAFIHAMPAYLKSIDAAGVKWVSGYPENQARGLPYISGLLILNDAGTGFPVAIMDATWITGVRTGAATAVAAKYLARPEARAVAILGCGVQGRSNLCALHQVMRELQDVYAYDIRPEAADQFTRECQAEYGLAAVPCRSAEEAVRQADVVVTAGPILQHPRPVIVPDWLRKGAFACTLDFDSYVTPAVFHAAKLFCSDDVNQLRYYQTLGYFADIPAAVSDLGAIVAGQQPGCHRALDLTVCANLGLAMEDVATAQAVYQRALKKGAGVRLPL